MKKRPIIYYTAAIWIAAWGIQSCQIDNYDEPGSRLQGRVTYLGQPVGVKATDGTVQLQLWQSGYGKETPINVSVAQDGSFSIMLFDGHFRLVNKDGNGPWENRHDTIYFTLNRNATIDYPVVPYYTVSDVGYELNEDKTTLTAKFVVTKVGESPGLSSVFLLVNKTRFVDLATNVKQTSTPGNPGQVELSIDLSDLGKEKALFARVGAKIKNVDEAIYSTECFRIR